MDILQKSLDELRIGTPASHETLTVFPLIGATVKPRRYRTVDEALEAGTARITEVGEAGRVPELWLYNDGDPVLLLDGEELKGAKQNRVLNLTILAPANDKIVVPVSCVEQGRWRSRSAAFMTSPLVMYSKLRSMKVAQVSSSLRQARGYQSNQAAVWDELADKAAQFNVRSETGAMDDTFKHSGARIEDFVAAIRPVEGQVGAVFAVDGRIAGCDVFDHPETLAQLLPKLVRSFALDAIDIPPRDVPVPVPAEAVRSFLDEIGAAVHRAFPGVGLGETVRISAPRINGAALVEQGTLVHLSAFRVDDRGRDRDGGESEFGDPIGGERGGGTHAAGPQPGAPRARGRGLHLVGASIRRLWRMR